VNSQTRHLKKVNIAKYINLKNLTTKINATKLLFRIVDTYITQPRKKTGFCGLKVPVTGTVYSSECQIDPHSITKFRVLNMISVQSSNNNIAGALLLLTDTRLPTHYKKPNVTFSTAQSHWGSCL